MNEKAENAVASNSGKFILDTKKNISEISPKKWQTVSSLNHDNKPVACKRREKSWSGKQGDISVWYPNGFIRATTSISGVLVGIFRYLKAIYPAGAMQT